MRLASARRCVWLDDGQETPDVGVVFGPYLYYYYPLAQAPRWLKDYTSAILAYTFLLVILSLATANLKRMMFTVEESQQKVSLSVLLDSFADKQPEKQQKILTDTLDSKLQPVIQKIDNIEKRVDAQDARMDTFATKIKE